jgi:hypothetical protein
MSTSVLCPSATTGIPQSILKFSSNQLRVRTGSERVQKLAGQAWQNYGAPEPTEL